ncbi:MAG: hypothetical protein QOC70_1450 [Verrucomicrobiota bacterium]
MICDPAILTEAGNAERISSSSSAPTLVAERKRTPGEPEAYFQTPRRKRARPNEQKNGPFGRPALTFLVLALPALWVGWLIYRFGVDTPWGDEWDSTRLLVEKMQAGTLGLGDFFAFHNEHRIFFPRVLTFALAKLTHWNVRAELLLIWILACVCSLNLWRVAQVTGWRNSRSRHWLLLGTNVLLFSPLQWENLLWGFQIGFFLPLATMTACLWVAPSLRRPFDFLATMFLCLISTFSIASGFASWFLTAPLLLLWNGKARGRGEKVWWLIWATVGVASVCFYFRGFVRPAAHPSPMVAIEHPLRAIQFVLAYLGNPFCSGTAFAQAAIAQIAGATLVIPLLVSVVYLWRCRRDRILLAHAVPWLSLTAIALVNGVLTAFGRLGFGMNAAIQSRYISFAILWPIGLLFLVPLILRHWHERSPFKVNHARVTMGLVSFVTALALLYLGATIQTLQYWRAFQHNRLTGKASLLFVDVLAEPEALVRYVHWSHWTLKAWAENLDRLGYLHPHLVRSNRVREIASDSDEAAMGGFNQLVRTPTGELTASGWAILLEGHRPADSVLLTYDNAEGEPIIFARVDVMQSRADVSAQLHDTTYERSGWMKSWKPEALPANARRISAWAFDAETCRAFPIGSATM